MTVLVDICNACGHHSAQRWGKSLGCKREVTREVMVMLSL
jgi:hypothetical protein